MIYRVKLTDFGPHADFEAVLQPGVNMFLGENGVGKSNIVYAIGWAILGPRALPGSYSQRDIIRDGTNKATVEVDLDFLGQRLTFVRSYDGKTTKARVTTHEGEVLANNATGVAEFLATHGFDWEAASVPFCRQRDLDAFVHESPANRKKIIASLLQLESLDDALKWVRAKGSELPDLQSEPDLDLLTTQLSFAQDDRNAANIILTEVTTASAVAQTELDLATQELPTDDHQDERRHLVRMLSDCRANIGIHERTYAATQQIASTDHKDQSAAIVSAEALVVQGTQAVTEWTTMRDSEHLRLHGERESLRAVQALVGQVAELVECPVCRMVPTPGHAADAQRRAQEPEPILDSTDFDTALDRLSQAEQGLANTKAVLIDFDIEQRSFTAQEDAKADLIGLESTLTDGLDLLDHLKAEAALIPDPPSKGLFEHVANLTRRNTTAQQEVTNRGREQQRARDIAADCQAALTEAQTLIAGQAEARQSSDVIKQTTRALTTFRDQLLRGALTWVSGRATQVLQASGDTAVAPAGSRLELDDKLVYSIVLADGTSQPVYRVSGGQAAVFSTCLRIALSEYLAGRLGMNGLLLLDAIFEPMNAENRSIVAHAIKAYGPPQTLLFSYFAIPELEAHIIPVV